MSGDGVSMPTQLAQIGSVAKTQARVQQAAQPASPFSEQLEKNDELKAQRIKEAKEAEKSKVDPDEDRRQRRKKRRRRKKLLQGRPEGEQPKSQAEDLEKDDNEEELGLLVDLRA